MKIPGTSQGELEAVFLCKFIFSVCNIGLSTKEEKEDNGEIGAFDNFTYIIVLVYFAYFKSFIIYIEVAIYRPCVVSKEAYNYSIREFSVVFVMLGHAQWCVGTIPT